MNMLVGRRYLLQLTGEQQKYAEEIAGACRAVWNTGLEQRRMYRKRGAFIGFAEQCKQLAEARNDPDHEWLAEAPSACLQQVLRDLDKVCREHGAWKVRWRSKARSPMSFRFSDTRRIHVRRVSKRWGEVRLTKLGAVRFRWTRGLDGEIRNATVSRDGGEWYVSFTVEDGLIETLPNGKPPIGLDRGVTTAVATSNGRTHDRQFITPGEAGRLRRLHQMLCRRRRGSNRREATRKQINALYARVRHRRADFNAWTANRLTSDHGLIVLEDLRVRDMTASAKGTIDEPGRRVRQKSGLNKAILDKGWGDLLRRADYKAKVNGSRIVRVPAAYTSQTCSACGHCAPDNRKSQAVFQCASCGHQANADVNAAKNILAAGLAVTGRGDLADGRSAKRQPPRSALVA